MEDKCTLCQAFDNMTKLLSEGLDLKESFHEVVEDLLVEIHQESFEEGYVTALSHINSHTAKVINDILDTECNCDECDGTCN